MLYEKKKDYINSVSVVGMEPTDRIVITDWHITKTGSVQVRLDAYVGSRVIGSHGFDLVIDHDKLSTSDDRDYLYPMIEARIAELYYTESTMQERIDEETIVKDIAEKNKADKYKEINSNLSAIRKEYNDILEEAKSVYLSAKNEIERKAEIELLKEKADKEKIIKLRDADLKNLYDEYDAKCGSITEERESKISIEKNKLSEADEEQNQEIQSGIEKINDKHNKKLDEIYAYHGVERK